MKDTFQQLQSDAIQLGATKAKLVPVSSVVIDERVRLKCLVPLCDKYNQHLMCPPNLPPVEELRKSFKKYSRTLFVQLTFERKTKVSKTDIRRHGLLLHKIIHRLEKEALFLGYHLPQV